MTTTTHTPRALTVRQPWADAIAHHGKHVENRSWQLPTRHAGARILIHAGAADDRSVRDPQPGSLIDGTEGCANPGRLADAVIATDQGHAAEARAAAFDQAVDELDAIANPNSERGAGIHWGAERLRRMAAAARPDNTTGA